jgi:hypothetical protein
LSAATPSRPLPSTAHGGAPAPCTTSAVASCLVNGDELDVNFLKDSKVTPKKYEAIGSRSAQRLRHAAAPMFRRNHSIRFRLPKLTTKEDIMVTEARETGTLIGSDKVEGTAVYGADDTKIGTIERVMIDKTSGRVSYAVLSFGGFLGIGDDHYPLPWQSLKYDTNLGGYRTGITEQQLQGAPKFGNDNSWDWSDAARTRSVNDYYGVAI